MPKLKEVIKVIEDFAPLSLQAVYDNCGLKVGDLDSEITGVLVSLDTNLAVVDEAIAKGCNLIIEHHPSIWGGIKSIDTRLPLNKALTKAIKNDIAIYSTHTNMDFADGGLNDYVAKIVGIVEPKCIDDYSSARIGFLENPVTLKEYAQHLSVIFDDKNMQSIGDLDKIVNKVAVINGGGGSDSSAVISTYFEGCDVFITGDVKYSVGRLAKDLNYAIIQIGHYNSEKPFEDLVAKILFNGYPKLLVHKAKSITNPYN